MKNLKIFRTVFSLLLAVVLLAGVFVFAPASGACDHSQPPVDEDLDGCCDQCGKKVYYDLYVDSATIVDFNNTSTLWLRFIPEEDGYYKWHTDGGNNYSLGNFMELDAGLIYVRKVNGNGTATYKMVRQCRHAEEFADLNNDYICDDCGERIIYPLELDESINVTLAPYDTVFAKVTTGDAGIYRVRQNSSDYNYDLSFSSWINLYDWLNANFAFVGTTGKSEFTEPGNYVNRYCYYSCKGDKTYYVRLNNADTTRNVTVTFETCKHESKSTHKENENAASCTCEGGYDTITICNICEKTLANEHTTIDKLPHTWPDDWEVSVEPSCSAAGTKTKKCTKCGEVLATDTVGKLPHTEGDWEIADEPSCSSKGKKIKKCTECGEILAAKAIEKLPHSEGGWELKTPATCSAEGEKVRKCTECGEILDSEKMAKLPHTEGGWEIRTPATCSADGERVKKCAECGTVLQSETIEKTDHSDKNNDGWCDMCSAELTPHDKCKYCGQTHEGFFGKLIGSLHNILYFFRSLFK